MIVMRLKAGIRTIVNRMVVSRVSCFQYKVMDVLVIHMHTCVVIEVAVMSTEENYLIADRGGDAYMG